MIKELILKETDYQKRHVIVTKPLLHKDLKGKVRVKPWN